MTWSWRAVSLRDSIFVSVLLLALAISASPAAADPCPQATFSRSFTNLTGEPVDGLAMGLYGPTSASGFYTGEDNPFGEPELHGAGPDGTYRLQFGGASVAPGASVRISFCIDTESAILVPLGRRAATSWLIGGEPPRESEDSPAVPQLLPAVSFELRAEPLSDGSFEVYVDLANTEIDEIEVQTLELAEVDQVPEVGDFAWQALGSETWQPLIPGPVVLEPRIDDEGASRFAVRIPGDHRYDDPGSWLLRFTASPVSAPESQVQGAGHAGVAGLLHPIFLEGKAVETVATRLGVPAEDLEVRASASAEYPLQQVTAHTFKLTDAGGEVHGAVLDPDGGELDEAALETQEQDLHGQLYGRLDPALQAHLEGTPAGDLVSVSVWAQIDAAAAEAGPARPDAESSLSEEEIDGLLAEVETYHSGLAAAAVAPVVAELQAFGAEYEVDAMAPLIHAQLMPVQIQQLAAREDVDRIYLGGDIYEDFMAVSGPTVRADKLHAQGITGRGTKVAFVEIHGGVPGANPYLQPNGSCPWNSGGVIQDPNACLHSHSTTVGGIIKSTHGSDTGVAPTTCLWAGGSCSNTGPQLQAAANRARNWGARAINLSWGSYFGTAPGPMDRFFDDMVINYWRTVVVAAGNGAWPCFPGNGIVGSPARAYNVITVGNFNDRNTVGLGDDVMGPCTSFVDPSSGHNDREKPEVSAPGTSLDSTTTSSPWNGPVGSGTSFAAPAVTGGAADLFQVNSALNYWPEATKAILMATAVHNIEGATRLSNRDGAGGIALDHARDISANGAGRKWGGRSYNCSASTNLDVQTMFLRRDQRTRVVLNWTTPGTGYGNYASRPSADLDLRVIDPNGSTVAWSLSWDNAWEIVDFTPKLSGNYRIRVRKWSCQQSPRYIAWAWWQDQWITVSGLGWEGDGAGIDIYDINGNGTPDMLLSVYDAPAGANNFRYKIGWDLDNLGRATSWSHYPQTGGLGWLGEGAGVELVNLDANPSPEMVLMAYDAPAGANNFRYKIGWNMTTSGVPLWWSNHPQLGGVGWLGEGAGVEFLNLDSNPRPEMVIAAYDAPAGANNFRYRIGWNMSTSGNPSSWSSHPQVPGLGWLGQGAGVTLANLFGSSRPEMLLMAYDNPWGANTFRYRIGRDINTAGAAVSWGGFNLVDGVGWEADGADPELFDIDNDGIEELFLMAYDDPWGGNTFRYRVVEP